ncbi:MAG TPA: Tad domain-containing protein [Vicinamibacterales bacterium]|nr:Tad domain-containing protein [Vicinamibacterales bacterium]
MLIHVALGVLCLAAFTTFVADYGLMWVARRQAQNSADAGAIAGATAFAFDDPYNYADSGASKQNAYLATQTNFVWGQSPYVNITNHITFPVVPQIDCDPDNDGLSNCVRVEVFRNADNVNALPMLFGHILGISSQNTRASAVALVMSANSSICTKPWAVADKWQEADLSWDPTDTFDPPADTYRYPGENGSGDPGTGFKAPPATPNDYATEITLKLGSPSDTIHPSFFMALDLSSAADSTCINQGADCYKDAIGGCAGGTWKIGDMVPKENGNMTGPTAQGTQDLINLDLGADWDPIAKQITGSCVGPPYTCSTPGLKLSPRVVAIPVFDVELYLATGGGPGNGTVKIVNILGFFVDRIVNGDVVGYLINKQETYIAGAGGVVGQASFLKQIILIR